MADDFWNAAQPTSRGYHLSALYLGDDKTAHGFAVNVHYPMLIGQGVTHHAASFVHSRLAILYPSSLSETVRLIEHWAGFYDPELKAQVAELAVKLAALPALLAGAGPQVLFQA